MCNVKRSEKDLEIEAFKKMFWNEINAIEEIKESGVNNWRTYLLDLMDIIVEHKYTYDCSKWVMSLDKYETDKIISEIKNSFFFNLKYKELELKEKIDLVSHISSISNSSMIYSSTYSLFKIYTRLAEGIYNGFTTSGVDYELYFTDDYHNLFDGFNSNIGDYFHQNRGALKSANKGRNDVLHLLKKIDLPKENVYELFNDVGGIFHTIIDLLSNEITLIRGVRNHIIRGTKTLENKLKAIQTSMLSFERFKKEFDYDVFIKQIKTIKYYNRIINKLYQIKKIAKEEVKKEKIIIQYYRKNKNTKKTFQEILKENS